MRTIYLNRRNFLAVIFVLCISLICLFAFLQSSDGINSSSIMESPKVAEFGGDNNKPIKNVRDIGNRVASSTMNERADFVRQMMKHAWGGYRKYAWGANELNSIQKMGYSQEIFGGSKMPATIVDAADTLLIMDLKEEFKEAEDYLIKNFKTSDAVRSLSVFEMTIRFVGGFLSLYALTGNEVYKTFAKEMTDTLMIAFDSKTGLPYNVVIPSSKRAQNYGWVSGNSHILADVGTLHLEFEYLSKITGDPIYRQKVEHVRDVIEKQKKIDGLYGIYLDKEDGHFTQSAVSLGAMGDSFYEYLMKEWLISGKTDTKAYNMYKVASKNIRQKMIVKSKGNLTYLVELSNGKIQNKMSHLSCFSVGMFALEAFHATDETEKKEVMELAEQLGNTCYQSYNRSKTGLGPEMFHFDSTKDAVSTTGEVQYFLRPEVIEGIYYLYKLTGKPMYQEWLWKITQSIEKWCRNENGYQGIRNVYEPEKGMDGVQQSFFLAETLKYLYLAFTDKMPLDKWVFNTEAHPLPIH